MLVKMEKLSPEWSPEWSPEMLSEGCGWPLAWSGGRPKKECVGGVFVQVFLVVVSFWRWR